MYTRKTDPICSNCFQPLPVEAQCCPACGGDVAREAAPSVNRKALERFTSDPEDVGADVVDVNRGRRRQVLLAGAAIVALLVVGSIAAFLADNSLDDGAASAADAARASDRPTPSTPPVRTLSQKFFGEIIEDGGTEQGEIRYDGEKVFQVLTSEGSRYDDLEQRLESVTIRLKHVAGNLSSRRVGSDAGFRAQAKLERYEVVWDDGTGHPFRIMDVTSRDVAAWNHHHGTGTSTAILANLIADELNALIELDPRPRS